VALARRGRNAARAVGGGPAGQPPRRSRAETAHFDDLGRQWLSRFKDSILSEAAASRRPAAIAGLIPGTLGLMRQEAGVPVASDGSGRSSLDSPDLDLPAASMARYLWSGSPRAAGNQLGRLGEDRAGQIRPPRSR